MPSIAAPKLTASWGFGVAVLALSACTAEIGGAPNGAGAAGAAAVAGSAGQGPGPVTDPTSTACDPNLELAPPRVWRLNDQQYVKVVHDVFGAGITVPPDASSARVAGAEDASSALGFGISDVTTAQSYFRAAQSTAASAIAHLGTLLPCASPDAACVETFIRGKVSRAFRRPVSEQQVADMLAIYQLGAQGGPPAGVEAVLQYVLQAPGFLWRTELPNADATSSPQPLDAFDLAAALSFLFVDSAPDDELWQKAVDGSLLDPAVLTTQVERLMALPAVKANIADKVGSWLAVHQLEVTAKDPQVFPEFTPAIQASLVQSVQLFLKDVVERGTLLDLVSSNRIYLNQDLATLYGIGGVTGSALVPVDASAPQWSGGILTQPGILAAKAKHVSKGDVVHRGLFIYDTMVCGAALPPPPAVAQSLDASLPATATERDRANYREGNPQCNACHARFDPLGLLSERYDSIGRYLETDAAGKPIDQSTRIALGGALDGPANGLPDLIARLKSSRSFADCAASKVAGVALGRVTTTDNSCSLKAVQDAFAADASFSTLFKAIATSPSFARRDGRLK